MTLLGPLCWLIDQQFLKGGLDYRVGSGADKLIHIIEDSIVSSSQIMQHYLLGDIIDLWCFESKCCVFKVSETFDRCAECDKTVNYVIM